LSGVPFVNKPINLTFEDGAGASISTIFDLIINVAKWPLYAVIEEITDKMVHYFTS